MSIVLSEEGISGLAPSSYPSANLAQSLNLRLLLSYLEQRHFSGGGTSIGLASDVLAFVIFEVLNLCRIKRSINLPYVTQTLAGYKTIKIRPDIKDLACIPCEYYHLGFTPIQLPIVTPVL